MEETIYQTFCGEIEDISRNSSYYTANKGWLKLPRIDAESRKRWETVQTKYEYLLSKQDLTNEERAVKDALMSKVDWIEILENFSKHINEYRHYMLKCHQITSELTGAQNLLDSLGEAPNKKTGQFLISQCNKLGQNLVLAALSWLKACDWSSPVKPSRDETFWYGGDRVVMSTPSQFFMNKTELSAWADIIKFGKEIVERLSEVSGLEEVNELLASFIGLLEYTDNIEEIKNCEVFKPAKNEVHPLPEESQKKLLADPLGTIAATPTISERGAPDHLMEMLPSQEDCVEIVKFLNFHFKDRQKAMRRYEQYKLAPLIQWNPAENLFQVHYNKFHWWNGSEAKRCLSDFQHMQLNENYRSEQRKSGVKEKNLKVE